MISAIVTDIEGTTSSLAFVKKVLFPYARKHIAGFIQNNQDDPLVIHELNEVRKQMGNDNASVDQIIQQLINWIDSDTKITPLKSLQGMIWKSGYEKRDYYGHIYEDAVQALKSWHANGIKLYVFSSGSVQAQKLLFANTEYGDLTYLFEDYFDTTTGAKTDKSSYSQIANCVGQAPASILFLSDVEAELYAARFCGMEVIGLNRESDIGDTSNFNYVDSFSHINLSDFNSK